MKFQGAGLTAGREADRVGTATIYSSRPARYQEWI